MEGASVGQLILQLFNKLYKPPKRILINNKVGVVYYQYKAVAIPIIVKIEIGLLIVNKSNSLITLTDFSARFYDGNEWYNLNFDPTKIPPYQVIEPDRPKEVSFEFEISEELPLPVLDIQKSHLEVRYKMGKKNDAVIMDEIRVFEKKSPYTWGAI